LTPDDNPVTGTGTALLIVESFPSSPYWLLPQHSTPPAVVSAQLWSLVAALPAIAATCVSGRTHVAFAAIEQEYPDAQSASVAQVVLHALAPHAYGLHGTTGPDWHVPVSSHVPAGVCSPFEHEAPHEAPVVHVPAHAPATHVCPAHGVVDAT